MDSCIKDKKPRGTCVLEKTGKCKAGIQKKVSGQLRVVRGLSSQGGEGQAEPRAQLPGTETEIQKTRPSVLSKEKERDSPGQRRALLRLAVSLTGNERDGCNFPLAEARGHFSIVVFWVYPQLSNY